MSTMMWNLILLKFLILRSFRRKRGHECDPVVNHGLYLFWPNQVNEGIDDEDPDFYSLLNGNGHCGSPEGQGMDGLEFGHSPNFTFTLALQATDSAFEVDVRTQFMVSAT